jgi:hypothetical protein
MATPLSERDKVQVSSLFYLALCDGIPPRMPPKSGDPSSRIVELAKDFEPPRFAEDRRSVMEAALLAAYEGLVPAWKEAFLDAERRGEALNHLLQRHEMKQPKIHRGVAALPSDLHQWTYLLFRFQRFSEAGTIEVIGFDKDEFERHYVEAREIIRSHL